MRMFVPVSRLASLSILLATACNSPAGPELGSCGDFGAYGCVAVYGQVVGTRGQALAGIDVMNSGAGEGGDFTGDPRITDEAGRFRMRIYRMSQLHNVAGNDSASIWIRAAIRPQLPQMSASVRESVLVRLRVTPNGAVPQVVPVSVTLPVP